MVFLNMNGYEGIEFDLAHPLLARRERAACDRGGDR